MRFENIYISFLSPSGSEGEVIADKRSDTCGVCELETESHNFDSMTFLQGLGHLGNSLPSEASQKHVSENICAVSPEETYQDSVLQIKNIINSERHQHPPSPLRAHTEPCLKDTWEGLFPAAQRMRISSLSWVRWVQL